MSRASYSIKSDAVGEPLVLKDEGPWDKHMTITNDAENVVSELRYNGFLPPGRRLFYLDSEGVLDEIVLDDQQMFKGFRPGPICPSCLNQEHEGMATVKDKPSDHGRAE